LLREVFLGRSRSRWHGSRVLHQELVLDLLLILGEGSSCGVEASRHGGQKPPQQLEVRLHLARSPHRQA